MLTEKQVKDWVKALRSGKYRQCFGIIAESDGSVCALGVKCKVLGEDNMGYERNLRRWFVIFVENMNDKAKLSFPEIADWIEGLDAAEREWAKEMGVEPWE